MDYPANWDKCESEYNKHYDPYCDACDAEERDLCICEEREDE